MIHESTYHVRVRPFPSFHEDSLMPSLSGSEVIKLGSLSEKGQQLAHHN